MTPRELAKAAIARGALQKVKELTSFVSVIRDRELGVIVEIGTARGGMFYLWTQLAPDAAEIISIDLPGGAFGGGYTEAEIEKLRAYAKPGQRVHFLRSDSHSPSTRERLRSILGSRPIDLLMIDGDHTYEGVKADWKDYSTLVAHDGVIVLHDILLHPKVPSCQVDRLWRELKPQFAHIEIVDPFDERGWGPWGGLGVIYYTKLSGGDA